MPSFKHAAGSANSVIPLFGCCVIGLFRDCALTHSEATGFGVFAGYQILVVDYFVALWIPHLWRLVRSCFFLVFGDCVASSPKHYSPLTCLTLLLSAKVVSLLI